MRSALNSILVGHADNANLRSGVTVLLCERPLLASVHVMGAAPGTRETELLSPENTVSHVDAIVLSGGSAFGLDAASGVTESLRQQGRGFAVGDQVVPIVPSAILFDLTNGGDKSWNGASPYAQLGRDAMAAAHSDFTVGGVGAGLGATTANLRGGFGYAQTILNDGLMVSAYVAVNAVGQVTMGDAPNFWAAPFENNAEFGGLGLSQDIAGAAEVRLKQAPKPAENTTIGVIATNAKVSKAQAKRLAISAHDGYARAIWPCHTPMDGDVVFALSTEEIEYENVIVLNAAAASTMSRAIACAIYNVAPQQNDILLSWQQMFGS
ncbi:MAG: peptidase T4 [Hyphomicrobiales bacterium]|nr:MAG: peptidase T4 [Hyphomicrobiales bacterium]